MKLKNRSPKDLMSAAGRRSGFSPPAPPPPRAVGSPQTWNQLRGTIGKLAKSRSEWAGYPMPNDVARLVMAPKHPLFKNLNGIKFKRDGSGTEDPGETVPIVNSWHSPEKRACVVLFKENDRVVHTILPEGPMQRLRGMIDCIAISQTMDVEAEKRAVDTLGTLITPHMYRSYQMTGTFFETSQRSGVVYLFRRLATTLAFRPNNDNSKFLAALCLHPLGYFEGLPMGVMAPTDDVIAHLVMMRSDEHLFWRKSNQHQALDIGAQL